MSVFKRQMNIESELELFMSHSDRKLKDVILSALSKTSSETDSQHDCHGIVADILGLKRDDYLKRIDLNCRDENAGQDRPMCTGDIYIINIDGKPEHSGVIIGNTEGYPYVWSLFGATKQFVIEPTCATFEFYKTAFDCLGDVKNAREFYIDPSNLLDV